MSVDAVADELLSQYLDPEAKEMQHIGSYELPSDVQVEAVIEKCRELMFPGYAGADVPRNIPLGALVKVRVAELRETLQRQIYRALHHKRQQALGKVGEKSDLECADCTAKANDVTDRFLARLPELRTQIKLDLHS